MMKQFGFTMIEQAAVISIITIMAGMAIPSFNSIYIRSIATSSTNWIIGTINFTRHAAITHRVTTTLCPSPGDLPICDGKWHKGVIIFADHNSDAKLNGKDFIIKNVRPGNFNGTLSWRSFRNRQFLQMTKMGYTNYQNGNFVYCPRNGDLKFARQIIVNRQGRTRVSHTRNSEGLMVDRTGKLLKC